MIFYRLEVTTQLCAPGATYATNGWNMDTYILNGESLADIRKKIHRLFGDDRSWLKDASFDLCYMGAAAGSVRHLTRWSDWRHPEKLIKVLYEE